MCVLGLGTYYVYYNFTYEKCCEYSLKIALDLTSLRKCPINILRYTCFIVQMISINLLNCKLFQILAYNIF